MLTCSNFFLKDFIWQIFFKCLIPFLLRYICHFSLNYHLNSVSLFCILMAYSRSLITAEWMNKGKKPVAFALYKRKGQFPFLLSLLMKCFFFLRKLEFLLVRWLDSSDFLCCCLLSLIIFINVESQTKHHFQLTVVK